MYDFELTKFLSVVQLKGSQAQIIFLLTFEEWGELISKIKFNLPEMLQAPKEIKEHKN